MASTSYDISIYVFLILTVLVNTLNYINPEYNKRVKPIYLRKQRYLSFLIIIHICYMLDEYSKV